ncbi:MAG: penicillin-binding protein 2 [Candidatus Komeilibacteria bacterium]|jgi:stage V sporulation protein D (sporulation-specific penicillin-binding protein)|nr:penicillin-binding protein 2 [Candidatus Komeilibacteria bacterium]
MNFFRSQNVQISGFRINALWWGIFFLMLIIIIRLFYVQILNNEHYFNLGLNQRSIVKDIKPERGRIFAIVGDNQNDQLYPLAVNKVYYEISVDPSKITRPQNIADIFIEVLAIEEQEDKDKILAKIKKENRFYESIAKDIPREKVEILQERFEEIRFDINKGKSDEDQLLDLTALGVNFVKNVLRYYPDKEIGSHILGFLGYGNQGIDRVGKYGLEAYFENDLAGLEGQVVGETDVAGRLLTGNDGKAVENGADIILTIDRTVQYAACKSLEKAVAQYEAESGTVIILETSTGAIRAMCNYPNFDPNNYSQVENGDVYNNLAVYHAYEPGSVMKSISMAIAIDQSKVTPSTLYNDEGEIKFAGGYTIRNSDLKAHGMVDMKEVLASSLNTGIIYATSEVNNKIFEDYMKKFGFGDKAGLAISQDSAGNISSLSKKGDIYKATASYGQGITVTPLQMVTAINAIANRGELMKPYIVSRIDYPDGYQEVYGPVKDRRVIDLSTASQLSAMMVHVVDSGHAGKAAVEGHYVAGKTGTAQVANPETGKYHIDKTIHNFIGFAPNDDPKFTMITKLDYPTAARFSSDTAAPLFGEIAKFLLEYYQIAPNR